MTSPLSPRGEQDLERIMGLAAEYAGDFAGHVVLVATARRADPPSDYDATRRTALRAAVRAEIAAKELAQRQMREQDKAYEREVRRLLDLHAEQQADLQQRLREAERQRDAAHEELSEVVAESPNDGVPIMRCSPNLASIIGEARRLAERYRDWQPTHDVLPWEPIPTPERGESSKP